MLSIVITDVDVVAIVIVVVVVVVVTGMKSSAAPMAVQCADCESIAAIEATKVWTDAAQLPSRRHCCTADSTSALRRGVRLDSLDRSILTHT